MTSWLASWQHWWVQLTIAFNQLANVLLSFVSADARRGAWADETISSRSWRLWSKGRPMGRVLRPLVDALFAWQTVPPEFDGHCHWTYARERERYQSPPEMRDEKGNA